MIQAELMLRKSSIINATLFISEAWHSLTMSQIQAFEKVDEALLRGLTVSHAKIPIPALYLETSHVPVRYILACRRILYLHGIIQRSDGELVKKVYLAQKADPTDGDFCQLVAKDLQMIDLQMTEDQIAVISYFDFKKLVKLKARQAAFKHLMANKETK